MLLLVAVPATSLWADEGSGTPGSPYLISSASDLTTLASEVNSGTSYSGYYFKLNADIDFDDVTFTLIGSSVTTGNGPGATTTLYPFSGQFDGAGHYISGINIDNNSSNNQGLFGIIGSEATVKDLVLTNSYFDGKDNVGGIAGTNYGTIENCHVTNTVTIHASYIQGRDLKCIAHGGIAGLNYGTVTGCSSSAIISSANSTNKNQSFGGIVGQNGNQGPEGNYTGTVSNSFAIAVNLSSCGEGNYGIIIGQNKNGTVTTNYYNGCKLDDVIKESAFGVGHKQGKDNITPVDLDGGAEHGYYAALVGEYIIATTQSDITTVIVPAHLEDVAIEKITYHIYESGEISFALTHNRDEFITDFVTSTEGTLSGTTLSLNNQNATVTAPWDVTVGDVTSVTYDGNTHYTPAINITDESPSKDLAVTTDYTISFGDNVPQDAGVYPITITGTGNYYGSVTMKEFEIEKRNVTLTSATDEKEYDGNPLTNDEVTVSGDGFVSGEGATYNVTGTILDYGETENTFTYTLNDGTKASNYEISTVSGTLTINKVSTEIVITANSDSKTYDGGALTNSGYTYTEDVLVNGDVLTAVVEGTITKAGSTSNNVTSYQVTRGQTDITANYTFGESVAGTLTVNPKAVTITAKDASRTYNGSALTRSEFESSALEDGDTHTFTVVMTEGSTITNVGTQPNVIATVDGVSVTTGTETEVGNYLVTTANGALEVTRKAVTITAKDASKTYNGSALTEGGFTASELETGDTHTFTVAMTNQSTITDAGTTPNVIATVDGVSVTTGTETEVGNYLVTTANGELEVTPKDVTITAQSKEFTYTGSAQSWSEYDVDGLVGDDVITAVVTGSITFLSESPVTNKLESYEFTIGTADNYSVTTANGELTMTNASVAITITAASQAWPYDGNPHSNTEVTVTSGTLLTGDALSATATGSVTNVSDTQDNNNPIASGYKVMHGEEDVTANYAITAVAGKLTINPKVTEYDFITVTETGNSTTVDINGDIPSSLTENELSESIIATEVTYTRTFTTPYATIFLPFAVSESDAAEVGEFYEITEIDNYEVGITKVSALEANKPYIVKPNADYINNNAMSFSYDGTITVDPSTEVAVTNTDWTFKGTWNVKTFETLPDGLTAIYFFASNNQINAENEVEIYAGDFVYIEPSEDTKAAPFRAYLEYTGDGNLSLSSSASGRNTSASSLPRTLKVVILNGDGSTTQIGTIRVSGEDTWFTIDGIQLESQPTEGGLYIRNGRAVMVK